MIERYGKKIVINPHSEPLHSLQHLEALEGENWLRALLSSHGLGCHVFFAASASGSDAAANAWHSLTDWGSPAQRLKTWKWSNHIESMLYCHCNCIDRYPCCGRSQRVRAMSHVSYYFIHHRLAESEAHWISRRNRPRLVESYYVIVSCHIMYILCVYIYLYYYTLCKLLYIM